MFINVKINMKNTKQYGMFILNINLNFDNTNLSIIK